MPIKIAGMVSEVFEYPFDLAKVRLQSQVLGETTRFGGPLDCLSQTWREEGIRGLYRVCIIHIFMASCAYRMLAEGLPVPLFGAMAETAALFVAYSEIQNIIKRQSHLKKDDKLSILQLGLAAGGAGFLTSFILCAIQTPPAKMAY